MSEWKNEIFDLQNALLRLKISKEQVEDLKIKALNCDEIPKDIDESLCLAFLCHTNDIDKAIDRLKFYFKCKRSSPEFFQNRDVNSKEIQQTLKILDYVLLPITPDESNLLLHRLSDTTSSRDPKKYIFDDSVKAFIMMSETGLLTDGPRADQIYIFDLKGMSFGHLFRPGISSMMKGMRFLEDGCPLHIKAIHVFNAASYLNLIIAMVKPFTRSKLLERVHFHTSNINWDDFYRDHIPKSHLPADYGGELETIKVLHEKSCEKLMKMGKYFKYEEYSIFSTR